MRWRPCTPPRCCARLTRRPAIARPGASSPICARLPIYSPLMNRADDPDHRPAANAEDEAARSIRIARKSAWAAVAIAVAVIAGLIGFIAVIWAEIGDAGLTTAGWIAMALGIVVSL